MRHYLFSSHDGFGLGHLRRNTQIAHALLNLDPTAAITIVTGVAVRPRWLGDPRIRVVAVPPLIKGGDGSYRHPGMSFEEAIAARSRTIDQVIAAIRPDAVVVDRHPYGLAGELQAGLDRAKDDGAALVLGLRDVLDEPTRIRAELAGAGWDGVADRFDSLLVYGDQALCDHQAEYGLPMEPVYTGWVGPRVTPADCAGRDERLLVVSAGGGGDGEQVFDLGRQVLDARPGWRGVIIAGPYAADLPEAAAGDRVRIEKGRPTCVDLLVGAGAALQMAGYNSTVEALACGLRPILVPRRSPRREQAIRASRLAAFGLADVVDEGADPDEVAWLLDRSAQRRDPGGTHAVQDAGLRLDGADRAARAVHALATRRVRVS